MIDSIFALPLITTALFYLGARAVITEPLWRRYPKWLDSLMSCAACSGFHYGLITAGVGYTFDVPFLDSTSWYTIPVAGLMSVVWTPIVAAKMERALVELSWPTVEPVTPTLSMEPPAA